MIEQKIIIRLRDENSKELGILTISSIDYKANKYYSNNISSLITLENIPLVEDVDNETPIQYWQNNSSNFANLMFLEETEYQILFESDDADASYEVLYSLTKINNNHFKPFRFSLGDNKNYKIAGTLNFRSYVGKSYLDIKKNGKLSIKVPIEVRSKKIDYINQYSSMIADLSQQALSLIFEVNSPLYQEFELDKKEKNTFYEDFMFLEYLFKEENLPSIFEYLSKNLHSQLKNHNETVPISFASNVNQNTLKHIVTKPNNLFKTGLNLEISNKLNGHMPYKIEQIKHEDIINIPENRFFKYFLEIIQNLIDKLLFNSNEGYIKDKLLDFKDETNYYLSKKFFNEISTMDYVPFNSQILQKKEGYREIFHYFLMLEFSFRLNWNEINDQFKGLEKKLSELYEYWCYFNLLKVLNKLSTDKINFEDVFEINKDKWSMSIKKGVKSLKKFNINLYNYDIKIELFYNLKFSDKSRYKSYSLAFKPDYTLLITIGENIHYIHFDAKYRSELEVADFYSKIEKTNKDIDEEIEKRDSLEEKDYIFKDGDIYKMHTYKDSILKTEGSYVLYPGSITKRFAESDLIIPSVGAFALTPGNKDIGENNLEILIKEILKTLLLNYGLISNYLLYSTNF